MYAYNVGNDERGGCHDDGQEGYKDSLFCHLFGDEGRKGNALELYNALSGRNYADASELDLPD